jgi:hypothetical protein
MADGDETAFLSSKRLGFFHLLLEAGAFVSTLFTYEGTRSSNSQMGLHFILLADFELCYCAFRLSFFCYGPLTRPPVQA